MKKQRGFAVLLSSVVLMLIISIGAFIGAKGSLLEQQTANAMYRTEEAFENAEAGIRLMLATLKATPSLAASNQILGGGVLPYTTSYNATTATITSTGAGSGNASRTITQRVKYNPGNTGKISTPVTDALTSLGTITLGGSADITSVKAGGAVNLTGSAKIGGLTTTTDNSSINQNVSQFKIALLDYNNQELLDASGNIVYRSMTTDEYFMLYFGGLCPTAKSENIPVDCKSEAKESINTDAKGYVCTTSCNNLDLAAQYTSGKRVFWLEEGGMKINSNIILGASTDPVLILVMNSGSVQINGTSKIYGVVFVDVPDTLTTLNCSCTATASAQANIPVAMNKFEKVASSTSGATKCTSNTGCKDSYGTIIKKNDWYKSTTTNIYETPSNNWSSWSYLLTPSAGNSAACTVQACEAATTKCTPPVTRSNSIATVQASCSYAATAVSGSNNTPVQIEILGTWDNSGGGNALIEGAALTSGNFSGQGGINFVKNSGVVSTFETSGASVAPSVSGWSDLN